YIPRLDTENLAWPGRRARGVPPVQSHSAVRAGVLSRRSSKRSAPVDGARIVVIPKGLAEHVERPPARRRPACLSSFNVGQTPSFLTESQGCDCGLDDG